MVSHEKAYETVDIISCVAFFGSLNQAQSEYGGECWRMFEAHVLQC